MQELTLNILASDIETTDYMEADDCAITRALVRAGRPDLVDTGLAISVRGSIIGDLVKLGNPTYRELSDKVVSMYEGNSKPEDFTHTLIF